MIVAQAVKNENLTTLQNAESHAVEFVNKFTEEVFERYWGTGSRPSVARASKDLLQEMIGFLVKTSSVLLNLRAHSDASVLEVKLAPVELDMRKALGAVISGTVPVLSGAAPTPEKAVGRGRRTGATASSTDVSVAELVEFQSDGTVVQRQPGEDGSQPGKAEVDGSEPGKAEVAGSQPGEAEVAGSQPGEAEVAGSEPSKAEVAGSEPEEVEVATARGLAVKRAKKSEVDVAIPEGLPWTPAFTAHGRHMRRNLAYCTLLQMHMSAGSDESMLRFSAGDDKEPACWAARAIKEGELCLFPWGTEIREVIGSAPKVTKTAQS